MRHSIRPGGTFETVRYVTNKIILVRHWNKRAEPFKLRVKGKAMTERPTLRHRLRADLRDRHRRLDAIASQFDLCGIGGLTAFLSMHAMALDGLRVLDNISDTEHLIGSLRDRAMCDLGQVDGPRAVMPALPPIEVHHLAVEYVIGGASLGMAVLKKQWAQSTEPTVRAMNAYFSASYPKSVWSGFCSRARLIGGDDPLSDRVVADAGALFDRYIACALASADGGVLENV